MKAGDQFTFTTDVVRRTLLSTYWHMNLLMLWILQAVYHDGPISLYALILQSQFLGACEVADNVSRFLSKAPSSVQDYDGSGMWAKFYDWGPQFTGNTATWPLRRTLLQPQRAVLVLMLDPETYTNNLPTCLPDGEYLLRIQSLAIHNPWPAGIPQVRTQPGQEERARKCI